MGYIYLIENCVGDETNYKIGFTTDLHRRLKELQTGNPGTMNIIKYFETKWNKKLEFTIHRYLSTNNVSGEWFNLSSKDIDNFENMCEKLEHNFDILSKDNYFFRKSNLNKL